MDINFYYTKEIEAENLLVGYLHALNNFYQNNGFFVLPYPIKNDVRSVYIPKYSSFISRSNQKEISKYWKVDKFDLTNTNTYSKVLNEINKNKTSINVGPYKRKWHKISDDFEKCYKSIYGNKLNIEFNIHIVNYRTTVNVLKVTTKNDRPRVTIALRKDSDINQVIIGIILATTGVLQDTFYGPKWYNSWEENMSDVDYINKYTVINKFFKPNPSTLDNLRDSASIDICTLNKECAKHLRALNLSIGSKLYINNSKIFLNKKTIPQTMFTKTELSTLKKFIEKENQLLTYNEIAECMWKGNEEKFSYWAISKHINRIKNKLKALEGGLDKIVAKRGEGYILIN